LSASGGHRQNTAFNEHDQLMNVFILFFKKASVKKKNGRLPILDVF